MKPFPITSVQLIDLDDLRYVLSHHRKVFPAERELPERVCYVVAESLDPALIVRHRQKSERSFKLVDMDPDTRRPVLDLPVPTLH